MKLVEQWDALAAELPSGWESVRVRIQPEQPRDLGELARLLGSLQAGHVGDAVVVTVVHGGGTTGPQAVRRRFAHVDEQRLWCGLARDGITVDEDAEASVADIAHGPLADAWDAELAGLPSDWSELLCELELRSSDELDRVALLCAPLNPTRDGQRLAFTFRCARTTGYGTSPTMVRRCFERLDNESLPGRVEVLRLLSETDPVGTQGSSWLVGGRHL
jgi:hypothetical protein